MILTFAEMLKKSRIIVKFEDIEKKCNWIRDCAIIIWRGGSKISKVGLKIKLHPPELKLK